MVPRLRTIQEVIVHEENGDAFLLHVSSGHYYGLNRSGVVVWNAIDEGADPVKALTQRWPNQSVEVLRADAEALIAELKRVGLLGEYDGDSGPTAS